MSSRTGHLGDRARKWLARVVGPVLPENPRVRLCLRRWARRLGVLPPARLVTRRLEQLAEGANPLFFVQIGSNDASHGDPLSQLIREWRWRGIMVEPVPYIFVRLRRRWAGQPGLILENVAIADRDGTRDFHYPRAETGADGPWWGDQIGSFHLDTVLSREHVRAIPDLASRIVTEALPCMTFHSLCRRHGVEHIDLLHVDAEGSDYEILQTIDFERYRPIVVIYEHKHLSEGDRAAARSLLVSHGYECEEDGPDTIARRAG